jgi:hypothetical protein
MIKLYFHFPSRTRKIAVKAVRNWQDEMTNVRLHETLAPIIQSNQYLCDFEVARPLVWTCSNNPPIRPILTFEKMKGGELWPFFGISADFIPVIDGKRAVLRTGLKATKLDIRIDPRDHGRGIHFFSGPAAALEDLEQTLPEVMERAVPFWSRYNSVESLAAAVSYEESHATQKTGLGVENYVQASFARPFLLAAAKATELADFHWQKIEASGRLDQTGLRKAKEQYLKVRSGSY